MSSLPDPQKPGLKMKELVEATGVPKSTILYYVQQGMLPEPVKTSPNMAYYDPKCIDRIRYIQYMQQRHRLSLAEIRQVMETRGDSDYAMQLELNDLIFGETPPDALLDKEAFCEATSLSTEQVDALRGQIHLNSAGMALRPRWWNSASNSSKQ